MNHRDRPHPTPAGADNPSAGSGRPEPTDDGDLFIVDTTDLADLNRRAPWLFTPSTHTAADPEGETR